MGERSGVSVKYPSVLYPHRVTVGSPYCVLVWLGPRRPALLLALEQGDRERECCCSFGSIFQVLKFFDVL